MSWAFLIACAVITVVANGVGWIAEDRFGRNGDRWTCHAYAVAVGALCAVVWG